MAYLYDPGCGCCEDEGCPPAECPEECIDFGAVDDCTYCGGDAPWRYSIDFGASPPCFTCCPNAAGVHIVCWSTDCTWVSREFSCSADTYRWELEIQNGEATLSLVRTAGSGTLIEVEYLRGDTFDCLCINPMTLDSSANCDDARPLVCVEPIFETDSCANCDEGNQAAECWELVLAGITDRVCTDCELLNTTYVLTRVAGGGGDSCIWEAEANVCGVVNDMLFTITASAGMRLEIFNTVGALIVRWSTSVADPINCADANVLTFETAGLQCRTYPATVTLVPIDCPDSVADDCP